jgi:thioredoxin-related protein
MSMQSITKYARVVITVVAIAWLSAAAVHGQTRAIPSAESLINAALKTAKADNKVVLLKFRADWCQWCARLEKAIRSPELSSFFSDNYVLVDLTVQESPDKVALETPGADAILAEVGAGKAGIPVVVFMDKDGQKIANSLVMPKGGNIGYPATPEEIAAFAGLLDKTAPRMTAAQRTAVVEWLTKNAPKLG